MYCVYQVSHQVGRSPPLGVSSDLVVVLSRELAFLHDGLVCSPQLCHLLLHLSVAEGLQLQLEFLLEVRVDFVVLRQDLLQLSPVLRVYDIILHSLLEIFTQNNSLFRFFFLWQVYFKETNGIKCKFS